MLAVIVQAYLLTEEVDRDVVLVWHVQLFFRRSVVEKHVREQLHILLGLTRLLGNDTVPLSIVAEASELALPTDNAVVAVVIMLGRVV